MLDQRFHPLHNLPRCFSGVLYSVPLDDERMEISENGAIYERRLVKKILITGSPEEGAFRFGTNKSWKITEIEARALYPDGREKSISPDEIAVVPDFEDYILYSDQKSHSFRFPGLQPGTIIEVHIKRKIDNLVYWEPAIFQSDIPIITKRYTLIHPDGLDFAVHASLMPEIPDSIYSLPRGGKKIVWERHDIEPFEPEERMPPGMEYYPALWFFARGAMELGEPLDLESWDGVVDWYSNIWYLHYLTYVSRGGQTGCATQRSPGRGGMPSYRITCSGIPQKAKLVFM